MAFFIVLERKIDGLNTEMDGKALSSANDSLEALARNFGVRPLLEFFSVSPEVSRDFIGGEGIDSSEFELPPLEHHSAEEGLKTIRALMAYDGDRKEQVIEDLRRCETILLGAQRHGVGWHLEIDI